MKPNYLVISCSLNPESKSRVLAKAAQEALHKENVPTEFIDLRDWPLPLCDGNEAYESDNVQKLGEKIKRAHAILLSVPIYNFDVSAAAKNLVELTGSALEDKVVGFLCAAGGNASYMSVMSFANSLMLDFRCLILPRFVYATGAAFGRDRLTDTGIRKRVEELSAETIRITSALHGEQKLEKEAEYAGICETNEILFPRG